MEVNCDYDSFEDYLCGLIKQDVKIEVDGAGSLAMQMAEDVRERILAGIEGSSE